jgi:hypothetical protein
MKNKSVKYDILLKGGRVIDPANNIDDLFDVGISGGFRANVGKSISEKDASILLAGSITRPPLRRMSYLTDLFFMKLFFLYYWILYVLLVDSYQYDYYYPFYSKYSSKFLQLLLRQY